MFLNNLGFLNQEPWKTCSKDERPSPGTFCWNIRGQTDENKLVKETEGQNQ